MIGLDSRNPLYDVTGDLVKIGDRVIVLKMWWKQSQFIEGVYEGHNKTYLYIRYNDCPNQFHYTIELVKVENKYKIFK